MRMLRNQCKPLDIWCAFHENFHEDFEDDCVGFFFVKKKRLEAIQPVDFLSHWHLMLKLTSYYNKIKETPMFNESRTEA